jgi:hypothetical protein
MTQAEFNLYVQTNSTRRPSRTGAGFDWSGRGFPLTTTGSVVILSLVLTFGGFGALHNANLGMPAEGEVVLMAHEGHLTQAQAVRDPNA